MKKLFILGIGILLVGIFGYFGSTWYKKMNTSSIGVSDRSEDRLFQVAGVLERNNPGLKINTWYLLGEKSGTPADKMPLIFASSSECLSGNKSIDCAALDFPNGTRARVRGVRLAEGIEVVEFVAESAADLIVLNNITGGDRLKSPLPVLGRARGNWYFEATFPIRLVGKDGRVITSTFAQADGDWMTTSFVPFSSKVYFNVTTDTPADLVLAADNPSGLPQNDREIRVPVVLVPGEEMEKVKLYYYDETKDRDEAGNVKCSEAGLVAVERSITKTENIIFETVKMLLEGKLTDVERSRGIVSEFPLDGVRLESSKQEKDAVTLTFSDPKNKTGGGSCRVGILRSEIEKTVRQFPGVKTVKIMPEELFQP